MARECAKAAGREHGLAAAGEHGETDGAYDSGVEDEPLGRVCLFCGKRPVTLEHAVPEWLLRELGIFGSKGRMQAWFGPVETPREWVGSEITAKAVCHDCNQGWMSQLEIAAIPIIKPLLADLSFPVDQPQQRTLSLWAVKTAIAVGASAPKQHESVYSQGQCDRLRALEMPPHTMVFVGRNAVSDETFASSRGLLQPVPVAPSSGTSPLEEGSATTLGLGRLVFQVVHVRVRPGNEAERITLHPRPGDWSRLLVQLWPPERDTVYWPPASSVSHTRVTLDALAERFGWGGTGVGR